MNKEKFNFFMPIEISKAKNKDGEETMKINGVASTRDKDAQGEILEPSGFDLSYFKKAGFFNWHHQVKNNPAAIIGFPTEAKINANGELYVEGELFKDSELAKSVYKLGETLQKSKSGRKLGFSVEGQAEQRDPVNPKRITKAKINHIAITHAPINSNSFMGIVKGECDEEFIEYDFEGEVIIEDKIEKAEGDLILDIIKGGEHITLDKNFNIVIEKAKTAEGLEKEGMVKEDIEGVKSNINKENGEEDKKKKDEKLTKAEALLVLMKAQEEGMIEIDSRIEKGISESFNNCSGSDKLDIEKTGKEIKEKLVIVKKSEDENKIKCQGEMTIALGIAKVIPMEELDNYRLCDLKNQIKDTPKRFPWSMTYFDSPKVPSYSGLISDEAQKAPIEGMQATSKEQAKACSDYNVALNKYIDSQIEIIKIDTLMRNIADNKKIKLSLSQLTSLGF